MRYPGGPELPDEQQQAQRKAGRLEWFTLAYMFTALVAVYFALGDSQAMKAAWLEDILGLVPPAAFLIAARYRYRAPTEQMPWGYHRAISVAYLAGAIAIVALGAFILFDSSHKLIKGEHASIGMVELFDWQLWQGWLMLAVLIYTGAPPVILGLMKKPLAQKLHDKVLFADAEMQRADWMTAAAAMVGVIGIGFGLWWADSVAAIVIALDVVHDGARYTGRAVLNLMDSRPRTYDEKKPHPLKLQVEHELGQMDWVREAVVRMRELGHVLAVNAFVVPSSDDGLPDRVEETIERLRALDWKLHDVSVTVVRTIDHVPEGESRVSRGIASFDEVRRDIGLSERDVEEQGASGR
ncbi:MAG TPA: cation diffusion facilitator family transporter [Thermoleophilaceae bacterium]